MIELICKRCNTKFMTYPYLKEKRLYCGQECGKTGKFINCLTCNKRFWIKKCHFESKKYCSVPCRGISKKGISFMPKNGFKKGSHPGVEIQKGQHLSPATEFKKGQVPFNFKGDNASYFAIHIWVNAHKLKTGICQVCSKVGKTEWANLSHEYKRDVSDYEEMCHKCNAAYDIKTDNWGSATKKFNLNKVKSKI